MTDYNFDSNLDDSSKIINLWPTPVYKTNINRPFSYLETNFLHQKHKLHPLSDNYRTDDCYILSNTQLDGIAKFILDECEKYVKNVINPKNQLEIYFLQSWLSYTGKDQAHHPHYHTNSFISGVFYFDVEEDIDSINFYNNSSGWNNRSMIHFDNSPTAWVSKRITVPVKNGDLVIFPSFLDHGVDVKPNTNKVRKSLAFNTWLSGDMGTDSALNKNNFPKHDHNT